MGREAYLNRVVLGRSAFEAPLRDDEGEFILGGQARLFDDRSYVQQWDDRGHPHNPESERRARKFRQAQNEVLQACGVVVRKDAAKTEWRRRKEVPRSTQLADVEEENNTGFLFKGVDRINGIICSWWLHNLRKRLTVFGSPSTRLTDTISKGYNASPTDFLFAGLPTGLTAGFTRIIRQCETEETGIEPVNFLEVKWADSPSIFKERLRLWTEWAVFMCIEIPFEFASVLQTLGFSVLPALVDWIRTSFRLESSSGHRLSGRPLSMALTRSVLLYFIRDWLHFQLRRRLYQLIGQILIRPVRPTKICVDAADGDDMIDAISIFGLGRSMGTHTDRRYLGPQSFWKALPVAFPWLIRLLPRHFDKEEIKKETLTRCLMIEDDQTLMLSHGLRSQLRAQNIISNLESLSIDVEEDFYVDMDRWTMELDSMTITDVERMEHMERIMPSFSRAAGETEQAVERETQTDEGTEGHSTDHVEHRPTVETALDSPLFGDQEGDSPLLLAQPLPSTPEPGIRRATSLTQTTPRPLRRPTETIEPEFDEELATILAEASRQRAEKAKQRPKDNREFRITRLSIFTADSLAWHASAVITSLALLPLDAIFCRTLTSWFILLTATSGTGSNVAVSTWSGTGRLPSLSWRSCRVLLLTYGLECVIRGALWQFESRYAHWYSRKNRPKSTQLL